MRRIVAALNVAFVLYASPGYAWGFVAHRLIMARAIEGLPAELKPFFVRHQDEILLRVIDPDVWRPAGWDEGPNHFMNFGVPEYGAYPFAALPREYGAAIEKFGTATLQKNGLLPWRAAEEFGNLRRALAAGRSNAQYAVGDIVLFAAVVSHYMQDAYQPLHATDNYDGQPNNRGIHVRFETDLVSRFESRLVLSPVKTPIRPTTNVRDAVFDALLASHQLVPALLRADSESSTGRSSGYDTAYYDRFFSKVQGMLTERLTDAANATAALIVGAWELAGRPALPSR